MGLIRDIAMLATRPGGLFRKAGPIESVADLAEMMDARAAFMAQKCIVEFCRVRAGAYWQKLFTEEDFLRRLTRARWRAYPPAYAMVAEMVEGQLREPAGLRQRALPAALTNVAADTFARYPLAEGESEDFWSDALALVREALERTQEGPPRPVRSIPDPLARLVFEAVPIHQNLLTNDYDYVFNNLRINLLRAHDDLERAARLDLIVAELLPEG